MHILSGVLLVGQLRLLALILDVDGLVFILLGDVLGREVSRVILLCVVLKAVVHVVFSWAGRCVGRLDLRGVDSALCFGLGGQILLGVHDLPLLKLLQTVIGLLSVFVLTLVGRVVVQRAVDARVPQILVV